MNLLTTPQGVPTYQTGPVAVRGELYATGQIPIPGLTFADALDINDQFGSLMRFPVPRTGTIVKALYYDRDDEGLGKELWLFGGQNVTLAAHDGAFALDDQGLLLVVDILTFAVFKDAVNGQIGLTADVPCWYRAPEGALWGAVKTLGADNIAALSEPRIELLIEAYT